MFSLNLLSAVLGMALALYFGWSLRIGLIRALVPLFFFVSGFGYAYLFDKSSLDAKLSLTSVALMFGCLIAGYLAKYVYDVRFEAAVAKKGFVKAVRLLLLDFRVAAVLIGVLVSILLSFPFYDLALREAIEASKGTLGALPGFWQSFYVNWIASLLFFAVVGLVAGLTALYRPEADVFAARVQILLGGKKGPAVEYIAKKLGEIGYVARLTQRQITIEEYSDPMKAFKLRLRHSTWLKNLYHDVPTGAEGKISFNFDPLVPEPPVYGSLESFRINGGGQPDVPAILPKEGFNRPWNLNIPGDEEGVVTYEHWCWYGTGTDHGFTLGRFTELLDVKIRSRCVRPLKLNLTAGTLTKEIVLHYDEEYPLAELRDLYPNTTAYSFTLSLVP